MLFYIKALTAISLFYSLAATASIITTYGDLKTDSDGTVIVDLVSGREYLRFDQLLLNGFYRSNIAAAIGIGGMFEGWSIADAQINDDFISAMFGRTSNACVVTGVVQAYGENCGVLSNWSDGLFGDNYNMNEDYWVFIDTWSDPLGTIEGVGYTYSSGLIREASPWSTVNNFSYNYLNYLLYREQSSTTPNNPSTNVPEPATLGLFGLGLIGLKLRRRNHTERKK